MCNYTVNALNAQAETMLPIGGGMVGICILLAWQRWHVSAADGAAPITPTVCLNCF